MKHSTFALAERTKEIQTQIKEDNMRDIFNWLIELKVKRQGIKDLMKYLATTDFYKAPCSAFFHLNIEGGVGDSQLKCLRGVRTFCLEPRPKG